MMRMKVPEQKFPDEDPDDIHLMSMPTKDLGPPPKFKMMWTPHGEPLFNMNDLMTYMFDRFKEEGQKDSPLIIVSLVKYQDKRKTKENECHADASESSEVGILPEAGNYHQFMGLKLKTHGLSKNELYNESSKMLKSAMLKHNQKWTNKQQAEWLK